MCAWQHEQQSIAVPVPAATHHGAQQNGAPQSQKNCHQSPIHTDRGHLCDASCGAPRVRCRERHGHMDAERALRATVTGQGEGLPQQRAQEVVDIPVPQIQESAELHSPERIDDQIVGDVPRLILNSSLLRLREETVGKIIPHGCKESRTVEHLVGDSSPSDSEAHPRREQGGFTNAEASDETVDSASGPRCSFELSAPLEFSTHTESAPFPCVSCGSGLFCE